MIGKTLSTAMRGTLSSSMKGIVSKSIGDTVIKSIEDTGICVVMSFNMLKVTCDMCCDVI